CDDILTCNSTKWRFFRWFPDTHIATNPRKGSIPRPYSYWEIKCRNDSDNSQRVILLVHPVSGPFRVHRQSVQLTRQSDSKIADIDHLLNFAVPFLKRFPHFVRNKFSERFFVLAEFHTELTNDFTALWSRHHPESFECFHGSRHGFFVIFFCRGTDAGDQLTVDRRI